MRRLALEAALPPLVTVEKPAEQQPPPPPPPPPQPQPQPQPQPSAEQPSKDAHEGAQLHKGAVAAAEQA